MCLLATAIAAGCGGRKGTLTVKLALPVGPDPFSEAAKVRVTAGDPPFAETTVDVTGGHFDAQIQFKPPSSGVATGPVRVEAMAADGRVVARGSSPVLGLQPQDETITVFVGPVGRVVVANLVLAKPRTALAAAAVPRLGVVFAGGTAPGGQPALDVEVLQLYSMEMLDGASLPAARRGAVAWGMDRPGESMGYMLLAGGGGSSELSFFEPLVGQQGTWSAVASDASLARDDPAAALLADGSVLLAGGRAAGQPLASAAIVTSSASLAAAPSAAARARARAGHTATTAHLAGGDGVLLFGGAATGPAAETFLAAGRSFAAADLKVTSRSGHTATARSNGDVIVLGGTAPDGTVLDSGVRIDPASLAATPLDKVLSTPRTGHSATLAGGAILVCGGRGADGKPLASCDLIDEQSLAPRAPLALATARTGHAALLLETGVVLLAGGTGADEQPLAQIEIYTP